MKIFKFNKMVTYTLLTNNVKARDPVGSKNPKGPPFGYVGKFFKI